MIEYEKAAPKEPIRIERRGQVNLYFDATGFCFAQHHIDFDNETARLNAKEANAQPIESKKK